ncbi:MAG: glycogen debranching enzyme family protein [Acidobacteria bacterium]|nr:glycogen debranching enzyme family protein [Acidobacteriota bacterium]
MASAKTNLLSGDARPSRAVVDFGRDICCDLPAAEQREWLVTNGIGGFASGTVAGVLTRRYHGLLIAALKPPLGRTLLVTKVDEAAEYGGRDYALAVNRWADGSVDPHGYVYIERFRLEGTIPVWSFAIADALVEKRVWMEQGANTTYLRYDLVRGSLSIELAVKALVNYRDYHSTTRGGDWRMEIAPVEAGLRVKAFEGATPFYLLCSSASVEPYHDWYRNFNLAVESSRGLDDRDDHLCAAMFHVKLSPGGSVTLVFTTNLWDERESEPALEHLRAYEQAVLARASQAGDPGWIQQITLAADQFIVRHPTDADPDGRSVIAGYHRFGEWGRDTMISLPGLTLSTGRPEIARSILRTYARYVDRGMLPNRFPDAGEAPEYNTVDAPLWYFEAIHQYFAATKDIATLRGLFPVLAHIVEWHLKGTRYNIKVDSADGLLYAGESGVQLTWMDAKVGDWVVTPRIGKPIEVSALWLNALASMTRFARVLKMSAQEYDLLANKTREGFQRFWNPDAGYCFDVLDSPEGNDASLRPNQIFAVSLPETPLNRDQQRAVVDICARELLTSHGLRSLAPGDPRYVGRYAGGPCERAAAYHQGTVWGWLLGPFVRAHLRVYGDPVRAAEFLAPMARHLKQHGLGTTSEIFDGDPPFTPRGCIAQAWSVAEIISQWRGIRTFHVKRGPARSQR